jgi:hypothetical protein
VKPLLFGANKVCLSSNIFGVLKIKEGRFGMHVIAKRGIYTFLGLA